MCIFPAGYFTLPLEGDLACKPIMTYAHLGVIIVQGVALLTGGAGERSEAADLPEPAWTEKPEQGSDSL